MQKKVSPVIFLILFLSACGNIISTPELLPTLVPQTLPPTWTPSPAATAMATFTEAATFTPVPAFTPLGSPTYDSFGALAERFQQSLFSPNGQWAAYREPNKIRVVNAEKRQEWTLPCELFDECSSIFPIKWSRNSQFLYFAPAPENGGFPPSYYLFTALAMINVRSGKWELLLPDSDRYYDFTFSRKDEFLGYAQSSPNLANDPFVTLGIMRMKNRKIQQFTLEGVYGGNIVWSPFRYRFLFQTQDPATGSSIIYFDMDSGVLKYILRDEQSDLYMSVWDENNKVSLEKKDWTTHRKTNWFLNPFTGDLDGANPAP